jgi:hypothetical protein
MCSVLDVKIRISVSLNCICSFWDPKMCTVLDIKIQISLSLIYISKRLGLQNVHCT